jgi:hypothetical protein
LPRLATSEELTDGQADKIGASADDDRPRDDASRYPRVESWADVREYFARLESRPEGRRSRTSAADVLGARA